VRNHSNKFQIHLLSAQWIKFVAYSIQMHFSHWNRKTQTTWTTNERKRKVMAVSRHDWNQLIWWC